MSSFVWFLCFVPDILPMIVVIRQNLKVLYHTIFRPICNWKIEDNAKVLTYYCDQAKFRWIFRQKKKPPEENMNRYWQHSKDVLEYICIYILKIRESPGNIHSWSSLIHFISLVSIYTPWKHQRFSDFFKWYRTIPTVWNGLSKIVG